MSQVPIYTPGWRETKRSKVPGLRKRYDGRGLNHGLQDPEFEVLTSWLHTPPLVYLFKNLFYPLNVKIKIWILLCCPNSFPGEVDKTSSKFIPCDHVRNSLNHSKTLILQGEIWCWSSLGLKELNTSISLQMYKFLFVPGHQQHCRCYSRRVPQLLQCLLQGQSHKDSFPSTDYELPPSHLTSSSPTKNSKTILTYGSRLRKFGGTEQ